MLGRKSVKRKRKTQKGCSKRKKNAPFIPVNTLKNKMAETEAEVKSKSKRRTMSSKKVDRHWDREFNEKKQKQPWKGQKLGKFPEELFTKKELAVLKKANTTQKIADLLNSMKYDREVEGYRSVKESLKLYLKGKGRCNCVGGSLIAAAAMWLNFGVHPRLFSLNADVSDQADHGLMCYQIGNLWGAMSKSSKISLEHRDPIHKSLRELAITYYEFYFDPKRNKNLWSYSEPISLIQSKEKIASWLASEDEESLEWIDDLWIKGLKFRFAPESHVENYSVKVSKRLQRASAPVRSEIYGKLPKQSKKSENE